MNGSIDSSKLKAYESYYWDGYTDKALSDEHIVTTLCKPYIPKWMLLHYGVPTTFNPTSKSELFEMATHVRMSFNAAAEIKDPQKLHATLESEYGLLLNVLGRRT